MRVCVINIKSCVSSVYIYLSGWMDGWIDIVHVFVIDRLHIHSVILFYTSGSSIEGDITSSNQHLHVYRNKKTFTIYIGIFVYL